MAYVSPNHKPTFLWQGLLIVLPVVLLATVGFLSLRQDKLLAEHEAAQRAQAIADDLLPKIQAELAPDKHPDELPYASFEVDRNGQLIFPPPSASVPVPQPFDVAMLDPRQTGFWRECQQVSVGQDGFRQAALASAIESCRNLIVSQPPEPFAAVAHYSRGLWFAEQGDHQAAADMFVELLERYPDAVGETGLPLRPLAELKLIQVRNSAGRPLKENIAPTRVRFSSFQLSLNSFCASAVAHPTPLTSCLLDMAMSQARTPQHENDCRRWRTLWEEHELLRELYSAARPHFHTNVALGGLLGATLTNRLLSSSAPPVTMPRLFWISLAQPWRSFVTNITSVSSNGVPIKSAIEIDEPNWLVAKYEGTPQVLSDQADTKPTAPEGVEAGHWFFCRPEYRLGSDLSAVINAARQIPNYFGIGIELAGRRLSRSAPDLRTWSYFHYGGKGGGIRQEFAPGLATNVLASAVGSGDAAGLKVSVYLTSPSALFERQAARSFWFGSLIGVAGLAAFAGLASAWRAFLRQQRLNEMKSNFVSSVSHELRAPIASVRLMAESLDLGKISDPVKQHEYYRFMVQECRRLSSLIENVLDFSRIEQGRKEYEYEPTDLAALVGQTAALIEPYAAEHGVKLVVDLPETPAPVSGFQPVLDGKAIQQALINLVDNAIKHSPRGETVTIGLEFVRNGDQPMNPSAIPAQQAPTACLWVEDHGEGIPLGEHEKIFERFYRRGSELRRETPGVGIGLSIVKHIVEAHRGKVMVESAVGQGSRFTIELPGIKPQMDTDVKGSED